MKIGLITTDFLGELSKDNIFPFVSNDDLLLLRELENRSHHVISILWGQDLSDCLDLDCYLVRSPLDYILDQEKFINWLGKLETLGKCIVNPFSIVKWNSEKHYLAELAAHGIDVVPTIYVESDDSRSLADQLEDKDWHEIVIKRTIGAGAHFTYRVASSEFVSFEKQYIQLRNEHPLLIQPFLDEITYHGEWSLVFFDKEFSHGVRKLPKSGDFRVQEQHGGSIVVEVPPQEVVLAATEIISNIDTDLAYARVDGCEVDGRFILIELELIEPELFFRTSDVAAFKCANALERYCANVK